jgi:thiamine biosynthesis lipoprotein
MRMRLFALALLACGALAAASGQEGAPHRQTRRVMGSLAQIQVYDADPDLADRAMTAALDEMDRVDRLLSNYRPDSELSRMNRTAAAAPFHASPELYAFVKLCRGWFDDSHGTFDPTIGPVVRAWGFFTPHPSHPSPTASAAAKARSGFHNVRLDDASRTISYAVNGLEFDPGGIGKGYAADRAAAVLRRFGIASALVSAGGSTLYAIGHPPGRDGWTVAVRDPAEPAASLRVVRLRDNAISTSGVSDRFVEVDGRRYGHIIDPRTGMPVEGVCQVSVVAPTATASDALTKPAFILPRDSVRALFGARHGVHVLRIEGPCDHGVVWTTPWSAQVFEKG